MSLQLLNTDCMEYMATQPDGAFDLAVVDPPYGIWGSGFNMGARKLRGRALNRLPTDWDKKPPGPEYFSELFRVSKNQIIWGGNYFDLPPARCVICWDKQQAWENFSQWEMAWTSFKRPAAIFHHQNSSREPGKIHPTQKPVRLYEWLLHKYAKPGQRVLDTHLGSGSSAIAAYRYGIDFVGCELDADFFKGAQSRVAAATAQLGIPVNPAEVSRCD